MRLSLPGCEQRIVPTGIEEYCVDVEACKMFRVSVYAASPAEAIEKAAAGKHTEPVLTTEVKTYTITTEEGVTYTGETVNE